MATVDRANIQAIFGIEECNTRDKYLGHPTLVGRNKQLTFNMIKERVWKKVRGWKRNLFSFGGKEVLIKAVAQAIPTYTMSIFQLDLSAMMSKFWWASRDVKHKISWIKWQNLCLSKSHGGLGFRISPSLINPS
ncbi:hypothetical protein Ddye_008375 [Dipteronia dyeriana]|uniref:Reverse transcriptase n=1 Tax=Dipteronia dyeriana TaxID=168575 RepID=A0AAD9X9P8_9ROSI|nr:hypothetical protein Ddye_008375 [Dipteronia dyeriana]